VSLKRQESDHARNAGDESAPRDTSLASDKAPLEDAELQARYRKEFLLQLRRLSCPGCGEEPFA
jgi:hypothetical protein